MAWQSLASTVYVSTTQKNGKNHKETSSATNFFVRKPCKVVIRFATDPFERLN